MLSILTTLTQRNLSVISLSYSLDGNKLLIELITTTHNLLLNGEIPITIAGATSVDNEIDNTLLNGLKTFKVINATTLRYSIDKKSSIAYPAKQASGTITANINNLTLPIDIQNPGSDILIYSLVDGYVLGGSTLSYTLKFLNDITGTTENLFSIPKGTLNGLKQGMLIEIKVVNASITTNLPIVIQV